MTSSSTVALKVDRLRKVFRDRRGADIVAVDELSLEVHDGEMLALLGPSGCGKSTFLRCVAGLERADGGSIRIGGRWASRVEQGLHLPTEQRNVGVVFQNYAIWPHMTVFDNAAFPLRVRGLDSRAVERKVRTALGMVGLEHLAERGAARLSGGEQQRLSLARAIVPEPQLLLLDEPLGSLDAALRRQLRMDLRRLQRETGLATVLITHDQEEALSVCDRVAVMHRGRLAQLDTPGTLYGRPANRFVAEFIGSSNLLEGRVRRDGADRPVVETPLGAFPLDDGKRASSGDRVLVMVRPEDIEIRRVAGQAPRGARVQETEYLGHYQVVWLTRGDLRFAAFAPASEAYPFGCEVEFDIEPAKARLLED